VARFTLILANGSQYTVKFLGIAIGRFYGLGFAGELGFEGRSGHFSDIDDLTHHVIADKRVQAIGRNQIDLPLQKKQ
jgi:hypothetical protein